MKRWLCILLAMTMLMGLCACGGETPAEDNGTDTTASSTTTEGEGDTTTTGEDTTTAADTSATQAEGTTTAGGTKPITKPVTKPTSSSDEGSAIRVLAIGDDYAVDAMEKYLHDMLKGAGYDKVQLGILYSTKSGVSAQYTAIKADSKTYEYRRNDNGKWQKESNVAPSKAFQDARWDYVVLQQAGAQSGLDNAYTDLGDLTNLVQKQCGDASILWHMNWSYRRQSDLDGFAQYKYNEKVMYKAIVAAALKHVMRDNNVMGLIPSATTIQNLRTSTLRDQLTKNGVRLTDLGSYATALTWYYLLTGEHPDTVKNVPSAVKSHFAELSEAAVNALSVPNEVTATTQGEGELKDLKILSIGHSFSLDAMRTYMWDAFDAAGYNVTIGYLYYPSCSLEQHYHYIKDNSASYEQYGKNTNGKWETRTNVAALDALYDEEWDIVTFQPDPDFGYDKFLNNVKCYCQWGCGKNIESDYLHFNELVDMVKTKLAAKGNTDVKFYYHLTWTWRKDCYLGPYLYPNGYEQLTLWQDFIDATQNKVLTNKNILGVIPCNTAIENARTSWMGDTFNAEGKNDGYHLNDKGDLVAALTWVSYFTGVKASKILLDTAFSDAEYAAIAEAVDNAIAKPLEVTQSTYKTKP